MITGTDQVTINWTRGNGDGVLVKVSNAAFNTGSRPTDGVNYSGSCNLVYSGSGEQWVYDGTGTSIVVTLPNGFDINTLNVAIFEYKTFDDGSKAIQKVYNGGIVKSYGGNEGGLPIQLISFKATKQDANVLISWQTATELNNDYFTLEKSKNLDFWSTIAMVNGSGNSNSVLSYSLEDRNPFEGVSYYRLSQTDFDGQSTTFKPVAVDFNKLSKGFQLQTPYINGSTLNTTLLNQYGNSLTIELLTILGETLYRKSLLVESDHEAIKIGLDNLTNGIYLLRVYNASEVSVYKIPYFR